MLSCEICFKNTYFEEHLRTTASEMRQWTFYLEKVLFFISVYCDSLLPLPSLTILQKRSHRLILHYLSNHYTCNKLERFIIYQRSA